MRFLMALWRSFQCLPLGVRIWIVVILAPVNFATLAFLGHPGSALVAALAIAGIALNIIPLWRDRGFTTAMAIPHVLCWTPLVGVLASLLFFSDVTLAAGYGYFLTVLLACDLLSLRWDIPDTVKWLRNRRTVHGP